MKSSLIMKSTYKRRHHFTPLSIKRSMPFIKILTKSTKKNKIELLKRFPSYVIDDITEILVNIVKGNVKINGSSSSKMIRKLRRYKKELVKLSNVKGKQNRRSFVYKQKGGFLGGVLPIATSLLLSLISNVVS